MIPRANITAWRVHAPWPSNEQVEQDLVLSRALVAMFSHDIVAEQAVFRGGTALHKLFFSASGRYSEDIDLVQRDAGPIGKLVDAIRETLDPWLGDPKWKQGQGRFTLYYRFQTTFAPVSDMRLKIEINTREHFSVLGIARQPFTVDNPWFKGTAELPVYQLDELLGTKLRALYQRKKGRDLYDLWTALRSGSVDSNRVVRCFQHYVNHDRVTVSRAEFEANLAAKLQGKVFREDIQLLIRADSEYDPMAAAEIVQDELIAKLPGEPWKGAQTRDG
ncbi:MAG: nucleotidyl transferase AbiEii/AbiGii toxin family protein [Deltaproteobacteria bacterium]|nr:nucleotidyl transferase AbiEii/AbiGii toxin family protein [Deltaproteobacteria bacterium]